MRHNPKTVAPPTPHDLHISGTARWLAMVMGLTDANGDGTVASTRSVPDGGRMPQAWANAEIAKDQIGAASHASCA